jgi:hypothetical protein
MEELRRALDPEELATALAEGAATDSTAMVTLAFEVAGVTSPVAEPS